MADRYVEQLFGLTGRTAVVVGGTGVLGGAIAEALAKAGAFVVVAGRDADRGQARAAAIRKTGASCEFRAVNAIDRESVCGLLAGLVSDHGRVDILVNCAGGTAGTEYFEIADADFQRVLDTNLTSTHLGCQIFGQHMADVGGGAILNIGSVAADRPLSRVFAYSAAKAAVVNYTRNVARELAPRGVRVNVICPGWFPTENNRAILSQQRTDAIMSQTPMQRFGSPEELAGPTLLLCSPTAGSFITGAVIYVDGGFTGMRL